MAKREKSYFNNLADIKTIILKLFPGTHQTMIGSEKSPEHRQRNEKICRHTEKASCLNELKNLATREKLEVRGINSTLGNYQIAVYLWNSGNVVLYKICIWPIE